jgi:hypothetical protein
MAGGGEADPDIAGIGAGLLAIAAGGGGDAGLGGAPALILNPAGAIPRTAAARTCVVQLPLMIPARVTEAPPADPSEYADPISHPAGP